MSVLADNFQKLARVIVFRRAVQQGFRVALNRGQRCAQFVGNISDEVAASFLNALGLSQVAQALRPRRLPAWEQRSRRKFAPAQSK